VTLHDAQELDNDLGRRADENLALAGLLGVVDGVERICVKKKKHPISKVVQVRTSKQENRIPLRTEVLTILTDYSE